MLVLPPGELTPLPRGNPRSATVQYPMDSTSLAAPPLPVNKQAILILLDFLTLNDSL